MSLKRVKTPKKYSVTVPELSNKTKEEKIEILKKYGKQANRRIKALREAGVLEQSGAYKIILQPKLYDSGNSTKSGMFSFSTKGKSEEEIEDEIDTIRRFLRAKTSTVSGAKYYTQYALDKSIEALKKKGNTDLATMIEEKRQNVETTSELSSWFRDNAIWKLVSIFGSEVAITISEDIHNDVQSLAQDEGISLDDSAIDDLIIKFIKEHKIVEKDITQREFTNEAVAYIKGKYNLTDSDENDKEIIF